MCRNLNPSTATISLQSVKAYTNFIANYTAEVITSGYAVGLRCGDAEEENYIQVFIGGNNLILKTWESSILVLEYSAGLTVVAGDMVSITLIKQGNSLNVYTTKNNNVSTLVTLSGSFTPATNMYLGTRDAAGKYVNIEALSITTTAHADTCNTAQTAIDVVNNWQAWTPTVAWTTGTPEGSVAQTARYTTIGNTCFFNYSYTATDGNGATVLTITLPVTAKDNNAKISLSALQKQNTTWTNPFAMIDDDSAGIAFLNFTTCTDAQAVEIIVTGSYEI